MGSLDGPGLCMAWMAWAWIFMDGLGQGRSAPHRVPRMLLDSDGTWAVLPALSVFSGSSVCGLPAWNCLFVSIHPCQPSAWRVTSQRGHAVSRNLYNRNNSLLLVSLKAADPCRSGLPVSRLFPPSPSKLSPQRALKATLPIKLSRPSCTQSTIESIRQHHPTLPTTCICLFFFVCFRFMFYSTKQKNYCSRFCFSLFLSLSPLSYLFIILFHFFFLQMSCNDFLAYHHHHLPSEIPSYPNRQPTQSSRRRHSYNY